MSLKKVPTVSQTRQAIDNMVPENEVDRIFQMALKYIYIIAGRLSEVYGEYSPMGRDTLIHPIMGDDAVIFLVKTARRKGLYRVIAVPLKTEKWASELYSFFRKNFHKNPFDIGETIDTSQRYLQWKAEDLFDEYGHEMIRASYKRIRYVDASNQVVEEDVINGQKMYLIQYPNKTRSWYPDKVMKVTENVEEEPKPFRIMHLRGQRENELKKKYNFSIEQARTYLGLKQATRITNLIEYDGIEPIEGKTLEAIVRISETYYPKFL
jgi:hypothetical protein